MDFPYQFKTERAASINPYFKKSSNSGSLIFTGKQLDLYVPQRFDVYGLLEIGDSIKTPGIMDVVINQKYRRGLNILNCFECIPESSETITFKGIPYLHMVLEEGDVFMQQSSVVQDQSIVYAVWSELISKGNVPYWMDYRSLLLIFDKVRKCTGGGIGVGRSVFEGIVAALARCQGDTFKYYRLSDMRDPMQFISLRNVSSAPTGTLARLNGSYFRNEGVTSALRYQVDQKQPFEDILRGLPSTLSESDDVPLT